MKTISIVSKFCFLTILSLMLFSCEKMEKMEKIDTGEYIVTVASKKGVEVLQVPSTESYAPFPIFLVKFPNSSKWQRLYYIDGLPIYETGYEYVVKLKVEEWGDHQLVGGYFDSLHYIVKEIISKEKKETKGLPRIEFWEP